ncbi:MAG: qseB [Sporomusa sp.]|jgi:DNA-binding response OmpR family regulator|nr:qseB [Sporomusa sp.]
MLKEKEAMRILLVEDEPLTARMINNGLTTNGIEVDWSEDSEQAISFLSYDHYDAIILALENGLTVLKILRQQGVKTPILIFIHRNTIQNRLITLESGADDFLVKPFSFVELLARLNALTRRVSGSWTGNYEYNGLSYVPKERILSFDNSCIRLSKKEGQLLELLLKHRERAVARETILSHIWGPGEAVPNSADALVKQLRQKVTLLSRVIMISTVRGVGYRLNISIQKQVDEICNPTNPAD